MARLSKPFLFEQIERGVTEGGWSFLRVTGPRDHPARYHIYQGSNGHRVRAYIWNITHGGGAARPTHEYRIQITGLPRPNGRQQFEAEAGGKTLILGWWDEAQVFGGFDYRYHRDPLGGDSPSIQIGEEALRAARTSGFSPHNRGNGELAIAFRPDFLPTYIANLESLHDCGESAEEIAILKEIGDNPNDVDDREIETDVAGPRRYAVIQSKRALRDNQFRRRVLTAYRHRCAMCGIQLELLDAAHILPVTHPESSDGTNNGISLCSLHHRAYDDALVTFDSEFKLFVNEKRRTKLRAMERDGGIDKFERILKSRLILPLSRTEQPSSGFVIAANKHRGWSL